MKRTQKQIIGDHLKNFGRISGLEAVLDYRIMCCWKRVAELEKDGWAIDHVPFVSENGKHYVEYRLKPKADLFQMMDLPEVKFPSLRP